MEKHNPKNPECLRNLISLSDTKMPSIDRVCTCPPVKGEEKHKITCKKSYCPEGMPEAKKCPHGVAYLNCPEHRQEGIEDCKRIIREYKALEPEGSWYDELKKIAPEMTANQWKSIVDLIRQVEFKVRESAYRDGLRQGELEGNVKLEIALVKKVQDQARLQRMKEIEEMIQKRLESQKDWPQLGKEALSSLLQAIKNKV
jgi:hypothetical protein